MRVAALWCAAAAAAASATAPRGAAAAAAAAAAAPEKHEFQAEVSRLMDIIVNSLYSKKEVFLRELISNSADALDKIRYLSLEDPSLLSSKPELEIRISFDAEAKTLTLRDSGIGMTKDELVSNLGTVARSGTTQFVEQMSKGGDLSLIGQFGVGFYSVYLVSDKVQVSSKSNNGEQYVWESAADSTFTVRPDERGDTLGRGTEIKLFLKEDALEYASQERLEGLVKRYSEFITFPIYLNKSSTEQVPEGGAEDEEDEDEDEEDEVKTSDGDGDKTKEKKMKDVTVWKWQRVNTQAAIWARAASSISRDEYVEFYKSVSKDWSPPLTWTHFRAEGEVEFKSILYVPGSASAMENYYNTKAALKLYVRKVLITDEFEELVPKYLNFIKGVVDSDDLPLSVSRETLQQHKILKVMGKKLVRKVLEMLRKMSEAEQAEKKKKEAGGEADKKKDESKEEDEDEDEDEDGAGGETAAQRAENYLKFWQNFGKHVKMGVIEDAANRNKLIKLLRFSTTHGEALESLDNYVARMPKWQKGIYFIAGLDRKEIDRSPFLERARAKKVEVLLMDDPLDEYCLQNLPEYEGHKLQSLTKDGLKFGDESAEDDKRSELYKETFKPLAEWLKKKLSDKLEKVVVSNRVTDTPAVLVTGMFGQSANMEKIIKHQAFGSGRAAMGGNKKILEVNPRHPIIAQLKDRVAKDAEDTEASNLAFLLYDTAAVASGFDMEDPQQFAQRMYKLMKQGLQLDNLDLLPEIAVSSTKEDKEEEPAEKLEL